ncbi:MAG: sulfatase-like hydrolase/transferase [Nitrospirae bacterium]|nr:sulfatase-like hydrolase/transferase [Nitrospirota bacterium]
MKKHRISPLFFFSLFPVVAANTVLSMGISYPLFAFGAKNSTLFGLAAGLVSFAGHYFLLNLAAGMIILLLTSFLPRKIMLALRIVLFALLQTLLLVDTKLYSIFRYHANSLVLNVITTEGVRDSVVLGSGTIAMLVLWIAVILSAEFITNVYVAGYYRTMAPVMLARAIRISRAAFIVGLLFVAADKGLYAYGDLYNITGITGNAKLYPLYQPLTIRKFASRVLHMQVNREEGFAFSPSATSLNYPRKQPVFDPGSGHKYNIVIIVLDGLRFDMLDAGVMPNLSAFANENIVYAEHYSGGNGTRFGMFSLLYGIHGSYWHTFLAQRRSPVLLDTLQDRGYDFTILSSTRLSFPEFRKTAFIRIPDHIKDTYKAETAIPERDELLTRDFEDYLGSRDLQRPFFAFLYYNSSHEPFVFPDEFTRFSPVIRGEINYFSDMERSKVPLLRNMYKNAVFYEDHLLGKVIRSLKEKRLLDNTIVVVTGDHGEEFFENGFWGHTSSFDDYQLKTAFVMHYPGIGRRTVQRITSHHDLVPTLMESLGCVSPPGEYSHGFSLLRDESHAYITAANWDTAVMIDKEVKIVYSTEMYNMGSFTVHAKGDYAVVSAPAELLRQKNAQLLDVLVRMSEFYKKM